MMSKNDSNGNWETLRKNNTAILISITYIIKPFCEMSPKKQFFNWHKIDTTVTKNFELDNFVLNI